MLKGSINQEDIIILNVYVPKNKVSKYIEQKLTELTVYKGNKRRNK